MRPEQRRNRAVYNRFLTANNLRGYIVSKIIVGTLKNIENRLQIAEIISLKQDRKYHFQRRAESRTKMPLNAV